MTQITSGTVSVEDGTKKAEEYTPPRKVRVDLNFQVAEGEDGQPMLDRAAVMASAKVNELLGRVQTAGLPAHAPAPAAEPAAKTPGRRAPKATPEATPAGEKPPVVQSKASLSDPEPAADASLIVEEAITISAPAEPVKPISDKDLHDALTRKVSDLGGSAAVLDLIRKYKPAGHTGQFSSNQIPQDKRAAFLEELKALKAA